MNRIGEKLHKLRQQQGLTTRQLAGHLDVSHVQVSRIETGSRSPSLELAYKIARYFNVSLDDLVDDAREV